MVDELPIEVLNTDRDVASGMHEPAGEMLWSSPDVAMADDKLPGGLADGKSPSDFDKDSLEKGIKVELEHTSDRSLAKEIAMDHLTEDAEYYDKLEVMEKEAMGLLDIPTSVGGGDDPDDSGEVGTFKGTPQNPGLSREMGDDEETDYFGAAEEGVDLPPRNRKYQDSNEFIDFMFDNKESYSDDNGEAMNKELNKLEAFLRESGKLVKAGSVATMRKKAQHTDAELGAKYDESGQRADLGNANLGTNKSLDEMIQEGTLQSDFKTHYRDSIKSMLDQGTSPEQIKAYLNKQELMKRDGLDDSTADVAADFLAKEVEQVASTATSPAAPVATSKGPITRPGDPYTYGPNPNGEGYVVISGPGSIGAVLAPGTPAFEKIKAADPSTTPGTTDEFENAWQNQTGTGTSEPSSEPVAKPAVENAGGAQSVLLNADKQRRLRDHYVGELGQDAGLVKYQELVADLKAGNLNVQESETQPEGRRIGLADFGHELPGDMRYDGVYFDEQRGAWVAGGLSRKEVRTLNLERGGTQKKELGRERRQERKDVRQDSGQDRRRERIRRREQAKKESRLLQIEGLHKITRSPK